MTRAETTRIDLIKKYMPIYTMSGMPYYPADLEHLEKKNKIYRMRKRDSNCDYCGSKVEIQVYSEKKNQFFDHCLVCKITADF
jgi:hypothetical protein